MTPVCEAVVSRQYLSSNPIERKRKGAAGLNRFSSRRSLISLKLRFANIMSQLTGTAVFVNFKTSSPMDLKKLLKIFSQNAQRTGTKFSTDVNSNFH